MAELIDKLFDRYGVARARLRRGVGRARLRARASRCWTGLRARSCASAEFQRALRRSCGRGWTSTPASPRAMKGRPVVLGYYFNSEERAVQAQRASRAGAAEGHLRRPQRGLHATWHGYTGNLPLFLQKRRRRRALQSAASTSTACCAACRCSSSTTAQYYEALSLAMVRTLLALPDRRGGCRRSSPAFRRSDAERWNGSRSARCRSRSTTKRGGAGARTAARSAASATSRSPMSSRDRVAAGRAEGQDRASSAPPRPTLQDLRATPVGERLSGRRDPRQPDRRHPRRRA